MNILQAQKKSKYAIEALLSLCNVPQIEGEEDSDDEEEEEETKKGPMTILIADEIDILLTNLSEKNLKVLYQFFELPGLKDKEGGRKNWLFW